MSTAAQRDTWSIAEVKGLIAQEVAKERAVVRTRGEHRRQIALPLEKPQGVDTTPLSEHDLLVKQISRSNASVRSRWSVVGVDEDRGRSQLQAALRRAPRDPVDDHAEAVHHQQMDFQARALADSQAFEERLRAARAERERQALIDARGADLAIQRHNENEGARLAYYAELDRQLKSVGR